MDPKLAIRAHIQRKCKLFFDDPDTVSGHIENERAVTNDYRGRVLYELLQNAVDRADSNIWITVSKERRSLVVANDGQAFSADAREGEPRSDLAALCSLHTSNKKPGESIGNKGVGFKSVWEFCNSVQVRTRSSDKPNGWSVRLRWPFFADALEGWDDRDSVADIQRALNESNLEEKHQGKAPSFYFPEYIEMPDWQVVDAVTAIELEDITEDDFEHLVSGPLAELRASTLAFVSDIRRDHAELKLTIECDEEVTVSPLYTSGAAWLRIDVDTEAFSGQLQDYREKLGFELTRAPRLTLAFPKFSSTDEVIEGGIHSYLPTEVKTGSPMHIQGDFYLSESRKNIDFTNNEYNECLLKIALEQLIVNLTDNRSNIAALPYVLKLLSGTGKISVLLKEHLQGKGDVLAAIFKNALESSDKHNLSFYEEMYALIGQYTPVRPPYSHGLTHQNKILMPYFQSFSDGDLRIVPVEFEARTEDNSDPVVHNACPMPSPDNQSVESKLFCRRNAESLANIDVPGVVVTHWRFPSLFELASNLKKLSVWSDYEAISVLRAVVREQNDTESDDAKSSLLKASLSIYAPSEYCSKTQWRFLSDEVHPSQRLLIPAHTDAGWEEVRSCFIPDSYSELVDILDQEQVFHVDEQRCRALLGNDYKSILKFWGVWDVIPLIANKANRSWNLPLQHFPCDLNALNLFSDSYHIWERLPNHAALRTILEQIKETSWLSVSAGANSADGVAPKTTYIGVPNGDVSGFHLINPDMLSDKNWNFLNKLGVTSVESTRRLDKLISTVELICSAAGYHRHIKGPLLSAYRLLTKRINQILLDPDYDVDAALLNRLPLFYESEATGKRGIASESEQVWYVPGSHRSARSKVNDKDILWWLASEGIATLASHLDNVSTLSTEVNIFGLETEQPNQALRDLLERDYLPKFMALGCYGDIAGLMDVDEAIIQRRWQSLVVSSVANAELHEVIGSTGQPMQETIMKISDSVLLWVPLRSDQKKTLSLYVAPSYESDNTDFKKRLCVWFAEEVFRRRELTRYFEQIMIQGNELQEFGVSPAMLKDTKDVIEQWLPDEKLEQLLESIGNIIGSDVDMTNWRDTSIYNNAGLSFNQLLEKVPPDLQHYLSSLNPFERNSALLVSFVDSHDRNLAALEAFKDFLHEDWLNLLSRESCRYDFSFDPESFVLEKTSLNKDEFCALGERIDFELKEISDDIDFTVNEGPSLPSGAAPAISKGEQGSGSPRSLVAAKTDEEHAAQQLKNAKKGKAKERYFAIKTSQRIAKLPIDLQQAFLFLIKQEYLRLSKYTQRNSAGLLNQALLEQNLPLTEMKWLEILHIGYVVEGAGYDYLDFDDKNNQILLVEAKSTERDSLFIHLSEPERRHIVEYMSKQFSDENPNASWRMLLKTNDQYVDVTDVIKKIVLKHHEEYSTIDSNMKAKDWVIEGTLIA